MSAVQHTPGPLPDPLDCNACAHPECARFDGPHRVECRAMADNACAREYAPVFFTALAKAQEAAS